MDTIVEPSWEPTMLYTTNSQYMCHVLVLTQPDVTMAACMKMCPRASQFVFEFLVSNSLLLTCNQALDTDSV